MSTEWRGGGGGGGGGVFYWNDLLIGIVPILFQHSVDVDLFHLGWDVHNREYPKS